MTSQQRRAAITEFLDRYEDGSSFVPPPVALPYHAVPSINAAKWKLFGEQIVGDELREITNQLNKWMGALQRWNVWNRILATHENEVRWAIEWEFVEPLAFHSMFQPSATCDRFILIATNALHQVRLVLDSSARDELPWDLQHPDDQQHYPSRSAKEKQLKVMASSWSTGKAFIDALRKLDSQSYRRLTSDFRNRASHGIPPSFSIGHTAIVSRERKQATGMKKGADGKFDVVLLPDKMVTSYGYGGTPPLGMQESWEGNLAQFECARNCFLAYVALLREATGQMPQHPPTEENRAA